MYTGQVAVITNQEDWVSDPVQFTDEDTGEVLDILNPDVGLDASVYIADQNGCLRKMISLYDGSGQVVASQFDDGPGIQWTFTKDNLGSFYAGTYRCGVKVTLNNIKSDVIVGTLAVIEGNR